MYPELSGKNALITGAARGFGRAIAIRLAREGVTVVVNYRRSKSDAQSVVEEITACPRMSPMWPRSSAPTRPA